jgi:large subunit ribosomal protein L40
LLPLALELGGQLGGENVIMKAKLIMGRMYQSMQAANEELRTMDEGKLGKDAGRLFRIAQEKKGVFKHGGVPIEYARWQTDTPGKQAWNHNWTR